MYLLYFIMIGIDVIYHSTSHMVNVMGYNIINVNT